jgi:hypothetical protein
MLPPPARILPLLQKLKGCYVIWFEHYNTIPKSHRYTLGLKIDGLFIETIEGVSVASFLNKENKLPWIQFSIRKLDTLKILLMVLWETKSLEDKKYIQLSIKIEEIGKMLGGWNGQIQKQNSPQN